VINTYFVRKDKIAGLPVLSVQEALVNARFRDSRDEKGNLTYPTGADHFDAIAELDAHDLRQNKIVPLSSLGDGPGLVILRNF
jgi:hypothetical protein